MPTLIGIDPAPGKGSEVFDGQKFRSYSHTELRALLAMLADETTQRAEPTVIGWDAPLTGPSATDTRAGDRHGDFTQRPIERFFAAQVRGRRAEGADKSGVAVLGYGGCPHWTITRSLVGLPRVGPFDSSALPFTLCTNEVAPRKPGAYIVETHPALAMWVALNNRRRAFPAYKKASQGGVRLSLARAMANRYEADLPDGVAESSDRLDAWVGWLMLDRWLARDGCVKLYGGLHVGTFLLPADKKVEADFKKFCAEIEDNE